MTGAGPPRFAVDPPRRVLTARGPRGRRCQPVQHVVELAPAGGAAALCGRAWPARAVAASPPLAAAVTHPPRYCAACVDAGLRAGLVRPVGRPARAAAAR